MVKPYLVLTNFSDLITADHKVFSDNCESRNNHQYADVVQDPATQWIQAFPCKNKTSEETQNSLECGKACLESLPVCTTPIGD